MHVFRAEKSRGCAVMSNYHFPQGRNCISDNVDSAEAVRLKLLQRNGVHHRSHYTKYRIF